MGQSLGSIIHEGKVEEEENEQAPSVFEEISAFKTCEGFQPTHSRTPTNLIEGK